MNFVKPPEFNVGDSWPLYEERLKRFFVAYGIEEAEDERRAAFLLTAVSMEVYQIVKNLCFPKLPEEKKFSEVCDLLKQRFTPTLVVFRERARFFEARQGDAESIMEWSTRLKKLAANCDFGIDLDVFIKNLFVVGLRRGPLFERVCEEEATASFDVLIKIALKKESTLQQRGVLDVHKIQQGAEKKQCKSDSRCFACGRGDHDFRKCQYKSYVCKLCDKKGHLAKVCPTKDSEQSKEKKKPCGQKRSPRISHLRINKLEVPPPVMVGISVNGCPLFSAIPLDTDSREEFVCYNGSGFRAVGTFKAELRYNEHVSKEELYVFEGTRQPLLGRQTMSRWNLKIDFCHVSEKKVDCKEQLKPLLLKHAEVFEGELGCFKHGKVHLSLKEDAVPKFCKPRKVPFAFKEKVEAELDRLEESGIISKGPSSEAEWGTPLAPVLKKDSSIRLCADYRITVNPFLVDNRHPFPVIDEIFAALQGGKYFSKLDLKNAYYQLEVDADTRHLLAWSTHRGVYLMNRLPFGTKTACAIFQATLEKVLQGCRGTVSYLDDVMVSGRTVEEHLENLNAVLTRLKEAGFVLNMQKCEFFKQEVGYLGHVIDQDGLHKDPEKVQAIMDVKPPKDVKEVRAFVGLANYYAKFCPSLAQCMKPLYELLRDDVKFSWTENRQRAFAVIKKLLSEDTVLVHYNSDMPIKLYCDASNEGIGAVIVHEFPDKSERPISFASRVFKKHVAGYSVIDKEALAIYYGINKFNTYLQGRHFKLMTDHKPLTSLFSPKGVPETAAGRLQRWAVFLSNCDYEIQHVKGVRNVPADFLSRHPIGNDGSKEDEDEAVSFLNFVEAETRSLVERKQIIVESRRDKLLSRVAEYVKSGWPQMIQEEDLKVFHRKRDELSVEEGVLLWGYRIVVPTKLRKFLLDELHSVHLGIVKMKSLARSYFWWPSLDKEIEDMGRKCEMCMQQRPERSDPISPWRLTSAPCDRVHVDHFSFRGAEFLVMVDSHSKWIEVFPVRTLTSKETVEKISEFIGRFGSIGTLLSAYLEMYRATKHATTGESPFKLMFGREMRIRFDKLKVNHEKRQREKIEEHHLKQKRTVFKIGETVYARDYRNPKKPLWVRAKIVKKIGAVLYECVSDDLGIIKRRSHQLLKYPFDDYDDEARQPTGAGAQPNDASSEESEYGSLGESDTEERAREQPPPAGSYNRVVLPPRRLGEE
ncbi:uncharacterized protein K02A2.6-like [Aedes albopictus]|uniref:RNA-directed DNA polymerase n=1 Tax=Aedes albopictus TaxID=7160 RepID=A0ABM1XYX4_AEDAL